MALVTGWLNKYRDDPFLRTELHVVALQLLFSVLILVVVGAAFDTLSHTVSSALVDRISEGLDGESATLLTPTMVEETHFIQLQSFWLVALFVVLGTVMFGYVVARLILAPARGALASQKQFIGNIAHELRTPLSVIKTNSEIALLDPDIPSDLKRSTESNVEELDRISEIINNLLSLSSLIQPEHMEFTTIDLSALAGEIADKFAPLATRNNVHVTIRKSTEGLVWGNMTAFQQILSNLVKNAITYTPRGGSVTITTWPAGNDQVELLIRDTGVGIARKDLFRIFEPFYRADPSRSRVQAGSGLGLTIVSELVRLHHGKITVRSAVGRGTTVSVLLPSAPRTARSKKDDASRNANEIMVDYSEENS